MTKLEEAARAICEGPCVQEESRYADSPCTAENCLPMRQALAVLSALLPPDAAMVEAGSSVAFESPTYQDDIAAVFTAMIQTAMEGK